jgi:hypothetical protein
LDYVNAHQVAVIDRREWAPNKAIRGVRNADGRTATFYPLTRHQLEPLVFAQHVDAKLLRLGEL